MKATPLLIADPLSAVERNPPEVWLRSFYGFSPEDWGFMGFTQLPIRDRFIRESRVGALVVIYGATGCDDPRDQGVVLGVQQHSHDVGHAKNFMTLGEWKRKAADPEQAGRWNHGVKALRAWRVTEEHRVSVEEFAPETYSAVRAQAIGAQCMRLSQRDARNLLKLDLFEVPVFGGLPVNQFIEGSASEVLSPSNAGPVSKSPFETRESEGPKHLYVLQLEGNVEHILGCPTDDEILLKVGFSRSPSTRCADHNRTLPRCAFRWKVLFSTYEDEREPFDCSDRAKAGEQAMKDALENYGQSLGGEFFRASVGYAEAAYKRGIRACEAWTSQGREA